jgi:Tfp pilus assembly protein PilN
VRPVNVATTPFRNERAPAVAMGTAAVLLLLVTIVHARTVVVLTHPGGTPLHRRVAALEADAQSMRNEAASVRKLPTPDKATLAQWAAIKELVDRRCFSWTRLLSQLEALLPPEVRLTSIAPNVTKGRIELRVVAVARPADAGLLLIDTLETRGPFAEVYPTGTTDVAGGTRIEYTMRYADNPARAVAEPQQPAPAAVARPQPRRAGPPDADAPPAPGAP